MRKLTVPCLIFILLPLNVFGANPAGIKRRPKAAAAAAAAGGSAVQNSTFTLIMSGYGDIFVSTNPGAFPFTFATGESTYVFTSVQPFITMPSTATHTQFSLMVSTERADSNFLYTPAHSSSFTVPASSVEGVIVSSLNVMNTFFPHMKVALSATYTATSSGSVSSGDWGLIIKGFEPRAP